jgi:hypothetical protein
MGGIESKTATTSAPLEEGTPADKIDPQDRSIKIQVPAGRRAAANVIASRLSLLVDDVGRRSLLAFGLIELLFHNSLER